MDDRKKIAAQMMAAMLPRLTGAEDFSSISANMPTFMAAYALRLADALIAEGSKCSGCGGAPGQHLEGCPQFLSGSACPDCRTPYPDGFPICECDPEREAEKEGFKDILTGGTCLYCGEIVAEIEWEKHKNDCPNAIPF